MIGIGTATKQQLTLRCMAALFSLIVPLQVFADAPGITADDSHSVYNTTEYYDTGNPACAAAPAAGAGGGGNNVFLLGDSILDGAYNQSPQYLNQDLTSNGWSAKADASVSRALDLHGGSGPGTTQPGLQAIKTDSTDIANADAVVIELGTNNSGSASAFKSQIATAIDEIHNTSGVKSSLKIYWVNLFSKGVVSTYANSYNTAIQGQASSKGYTVIDTTGSSISLGPDNVHPTGAGYKDLSKLIADAIGPASAPTAAVGGCCPASAISGAGTLPSYIKAPYNAIFTAAGQKYNVDPGVLVGIFYDEQYGYNSAVSTFDAHTMPDPPPPYGHGGAWSLNYGDNGSGQWPDGTVGARGPFQFEPGTWQGQGGSKGYGVDGNGDGKKDPTDLTDESFGAANYLAALGATNPESQSKIENAASSYSNGYPTYSQAAFDIYQKIKTDEGAGGGPAPAPAPAAGGCAAAGASGLQDPMRDVEKSPGFQRERIDEGVDFTGTGSVYAMGAGTVTAIFTTLHPGIWWNSDGGNAVVYKLSNDPGNGDAAGKTIYFAEYCPPEVAQGQTVTSSTVICKMAGGQVETGWALTDGTDEPAAGAQGYGTIYPDGTAMAYGRNFSDFLKSIGAPEGVLSASTNPSVVGGSLPAGWPTWR